MNKDPFTFLQHILGCIENIEKDTRGLTKEQFLKARTINNSVLWNIEVIGEAAKNIPNNFKEKYKHIPWKQIAGMRDKLIHEYFGIDSGNVWKVVTEDIPVLKSNLEEILKKKMGEKGNKK